MLVHENGFPSLSEHERTLVVPGSQVNNQALASIRDSEAKEAEAKRQEEEVVLQQRALSALTSEAQFLGLEGGCASTLASDLAFDGVPLVFSCTSTKTALARDLMQLWFSSLIFLLYAAEEQSI